MHNHSLYLSEELGDPPPLTLLFITSVPRAPFSPPWFFSWGLWSSRERGILSPCFANLEGAALGDGVGLAHTEFAQLDWLHLELMGRCAGLGLPWVSEHCGHACVLTQSCPTVCDPIDCSPLGSSVRGIFPAQRLEWVAISSSRESSRPRD